ncbi:hypothetical protein PHMEG_0004757 [Phytophthora megakarya]|uniref:PiggyBac transposable element-derived protein domain-containing protein n=1 Tax=Phytophthora megakarya TaxID=4795 RepID=A0A225WSW9_9STRA|nr:hypothetical protein PHMEG_0004757 [Phytophthora megakarya]
MALGDDLLALQFYFIPPSLWAQIATKNNRYHSQSILLRMKAIRSQQGRASLNIEDLFAWHERLILNHGSVLGVMGLLIEGMLQSIRKSVAAHCSTKQVGALPTNRFNLFNRFFHIMGCLRFSNKRSPRAGVDRAWKIRPMMDVLQRTFARGFHAPSVISFDEATRPSRSRYNPT